jgi:cell division protein FtsW (lipid II flippase)
MGDQDKYELKPHLVGLAATVVWWALISVLVVTLACKDHWNWAFLVVFFLSLLILSDIRDDVRKLAAEWVPDEAAGE